MTIVIVCGDRDFIDKTVCFDSIIEILGRYESVEVVSGYATGADTFEEEYMD